MTRPETSTDRLVIGGPYEIMRGGFFDAGGSVPVLRGRWQGEANCHAPCAKRRFARQRGRGQHATKTFGDPPARSMLGGAFKKTGAPSGITPVAGVWRRAIGGAVALDPETGEIVESTCPECVDLAAKARGLERDLESTQDELTKTLTHLKALKTSRDRDRLRDRRRQEVEEIFADWQDKCSKHRSKLTPDRHDVIAARLNDDYTVEDFKLANLGAAHDPWTRSGEPPMREIGTFAKKGSWLEDYANRGSRWLKANPESDGRAVVRHVYGEDCVLPYKPANREQPPRLAAWGDLAPIDRVLSRIAGARAATNNPDFWHFACPVHDDQNPSGWIQRGASGRVKVGCFAGCDMEAILHAFGLELDDLWRGYGRDQNASDFLPRSSGLSPENRRTLAEIESYLRQEDARAA